MRSWLSLLVKLPGIVCKKHLPAPINDLSIDRGQSLNWIPTTCDPYLQIKPIPNVVVTYIDLKG